MPPQGYERPARYGSSPGPGDSENDAREPDQREPITWEPHIRSRRRPADSGAYGPPDGADRGAPARPRFTPGQAPPSQAPPDQGGPEPSDAGWWQRQGDEYADSRPREARQPADARGPGRDEPRAAAPLPGAERIEQLLLAAQREIAEYARSAAAAADRDADKIRAEATRDADKIRADAAHDTDKIRAEAQSYAAGLRANAEFERASTRSESEREAAKTQAAAERERDDIVRAAQREADGIRRREQFLLEQSEALRSQAEANLDLELADRRAEAERLEVEALADAQQASRHLVEEAERRAADAEKRAAEANAQAEQARKDAEADAKKEIADAHRKAELVIAQAKDEGKQILADLESDADKRRATLQKELDELTRQKAEIDDKLAQMRQLFAVGAFLDTPAS
jgi:vacuolar-type H+-ATPase subunit H